MQLHNAYLVLETADGMLIVDQHALHERILFEQFKERLQSGKLETQRLLIPEQVELTAEQAARTLECRAELAELGLEVEGFGGNTVLVTSYPTLLARRPAAEILRGVVDYLMNKGRVPTREQFLGEIMSLMACHAAVRSGDPLSPNEIDALMAMRHLAGTPITARTADPRRCYSRGRIWTASFAGREPLENIICRDRGDRGSGLESSIAR